MVGFSVIIKRSKLGNTIQRMVKMILVL